MKTAEQLTDLRGLNADELTKRASDLEEQVFRLRLQKSMGQGEAGNKIRPLRRELARVRTILGEKGGKN
ncbi:MAG TPA: 50S ribosomal protein L29 [Vicinamibacterales bacterium]|nr:50S ribosomal protein L29 [Vicinamibacterales bacterium]